MVYIYEKSPIAFIIREMQICILALAKKNHSVGETREVDTHTLMVGMLN